MKDLHKVLAAGAAVYAVMAACSAAEETEGGVSQPGAGGSMSPSDVDAARDAWDAFADPVREASAQESGDAACGTCSVPSILRSVSADSDPAQHVGGTLTVAEDSGPVQVEQGPFYLTDARANTGTDSSSVRLDIHPASSGCSSVGGQFVAYLKAARYGSGLEYYQGARPIIQGARILVRADEVLCAEYGNTADAYLRWDGFRPYEG